MRKITREEYYHALALYILAKRRQTEVDGMESEMNGILGSENGSHASDAIYSYGNSGSKEEFDEAIRKMGVEVSE